PEEVAPELPLGRPADREEAAEHLVAAERAMDRCQALLVSADLLPVRVDDLHPEADQVGLRRLRLRVRLLDRIRGELVVTVQEEDVLAAGRLDAGPPTLERGAVLLQPDQPDALVPCLVALDDGGRAVRRRVVHADDLELPDRLTQTALERVPDPGLVVVHRKDDRDEWWRVQ